MNRRSSGFSVVGPEPEGPRYDGRQRPLERSPRTEPPHPSPSRTRRSTGNRGPSGFSVSTAVGGFLHAKAAEGLSPRTLHNYDRYLRTWIEWAGDPPIDSVTTNGIRSYLAWLRTEYKPRRFGGRRGPRQPNGRPNSPLHFQSEVSLPWGAQGSSREGPPLLPRQPAGSLADEPATATPPREADTKPLTERNQAEVGACVQSHLRQRGIEVVLSGGASVSIYTIGKFVSLDLGLVNVHSASRRAIRAAMEEIGFQEEGWHFKNPGARHIVELPPGPLTVGAEPVKEVQGIELSTGVLKMISPTDSVKDRLAAYYF